MATVLSDPATMLVWILGVGVDAVWRAAQQLVAFDTSLDGEGVGTCVDWLGSRLAEAGFRVDVRGVKRPTLIAHRDGGRPGRVLLYGHYDTEPGPLESRTLREHAGRWYGLGIADNKGALASRLVALAELRHTPRLVWCIQGEEETGSTIARTVLPTLERADLYLDETGYADVDGTRRILAEPPTASLVEAVSRAVDLRFRLEARRLNKSLVPGGCPFQAIVPSAGQYLAIGVNDDRSAIHTPNESIPALDVRRHIAELKAALDWVAERAEAR